MSKIENNGKENIEEPAPLKRSRAMTRKDVEAIFSNAVGRDDAPLIKTFLRRQTISIRNNPEATMLLWFRGSAFLLREISPDIQYPDNLLSILLIRVAISMYPRYFKAQNRQPIFKEHQKVTNEQLNAYLPLLINKERTIEPHFVNHLNELGITPVLMAIFFKNPILMRLLLNSGANPNQPLQPCSPRMKRQLQPFKQLRRFLHLIKGKHPLLIAAQYNAYSAAKLLVRSSLLSLNDPNLKGGLPEQLKKPLSPRMRALLNDVSSRIQQADSGDETDDTLPCSPRSP